MAVRYSVYVALAALLLAAAPASAQRRGSSAYTGYEREQANPEDEDDTAADESEEQDSAATGGPEDDEEEDEDDAKARMRALSQIDPAIRIARRPKMGRFGAEAVGGLWAFGKSSGDGLEPAFGWGLRLHWEPPGVAQSFLEMDIGFLRGAYDAGTKQVSMGTAYHALELRAAIRWPEGPVSVVFALGTALTINSIVYKVQPDPETGVVALGGALFASAGVRARWQWLRGGLEIGTALRGGPPDLLLLLTLGGAGEP